MRVRTLLVGTDLTERADQAILRGNQLSVANDARLVVCHVGPAHVGSHPLFPQLHQEDVVTAASLEERIAEAVSLRVADVTGRSPEAFDVVVDYGDVATILAEQAAQVGADLIVIMTDRSEEDGPGTVTRDLARRSPSSVLVLGEGSGEGVAIVALEEEVGLLPELVSAASTVVGTLPSKIDVIFFVSDRERSTTPITTCVAKQAAELRIVLDPWFADVNDTSLLMRVVEDATAGLVVVTAPNPDKLIAGTSSPLDEVLPATRSSVLLFRT
jgi:nucleotide-binding universal stress UspA family protein